VTIKDEWAGLWVRTQRSCITALDLARILACDAVILLFGKIATHFTAKWADGNDQFYAVAHTLSQGLFLLLYFVVACFHIYEFVREQQLEP
jgi:hypothetical protein